MKNYIICNLVVLLVLMSVLFSCSSRKDTATSRGMQNLTARYNYIYNSNEILSAHQLGLADSLPDNYSTILPVHLSPETDPAKPMTSLNLKPMNALIKKAEFIIFEKSYSNYIDDAYLLLGKANFFNGSYFNSTEYFDYIAKTYSSDTSMLLQALDWKARSLMQVGRITEADQTLDTLENILPRVKKKKPLAEPLATIAQMCIYREDYESAINYLNKAVRYGSNSTRKIRWNFILGQLYERQKNNRESALAYRKVQRSNAPYEMYFNATLGRLRLNAAVDPKLNTREELLRMLYDDKNLNYNDQIYFQVAENYAAGQAWDEALKHYTLAAKQSRLNQNQKGLAYLRMADLHLKEYKDYLSAKAYYDSAVNTLPKKYPGYDLLLKKAQNLQYLTTRYERISREDSLQAIARLPEAERAARIEALANPPESGHQQPTALQQTTQKSFDRQPSSQTSSSGNTFYFNNPTAIAIGNSDFKKKWGNRPLEDNWRQSIRSSAQENLQSIAQNSGSLPASPDRTGATLAGTDQADLVKQYTEQLPVTAELQMQSDQRIIDAYYEVASFYLQELQDPAEAEQVYETLLKRFPANNHLTSVYYSLYLINQKSDLSRAGLYKTKLLTEFPSSVYAKTILDPGFSVRQSALEAAASEKYTRVFEQYLKKDFAAVITQVNEQEQTSGGLLAPQFAYLKAIAIGRTNHVDSLLKAFSTIVREFPDDKLITPLVREHMDYIKSHLGDFQKRGIALVDFDPTEPPFYRQPEQPAVVASVTQTIQPQQVNVPKPAAAAKSREPFSNADSGTYYFVVHVADASLTLSSSRFGIGQFNRGNFPEAGLRHQLKEFDNDQLVYVGNFSNFEDAKAYASGIVPQLRQIMKVPATLYTSFIISKENFDMITSRPLIDRYVEFYKKNY